MLEAEAHSDARPARLQLILTAIFILVSLATYPALAQPIHPQYSNSKKPIQRLPATTVNGFIIKYHSESVLALSNSPEKILRKMQLRMSGLKASQTDQLAILEGKTASPWSVTMPNTLGQRLIQTNRQISLADAQALAKGLRAADPDIEYIEPNLQLRLDSVPNDSAWSYQWSLHETSAGIRLPAAIDLYGKPRPTTDRDLPIVAIIDSGYRSHLDLATPPEMGPDYVDGQHPPLDTGDSTNAGECPDNPQYSQSYNSWHGLHIHSIIAALTNNQKIGMAGIDPQLKIYHARWWGKCGGTLANTLNSVAAAISYRSPYGQRVRVINISASGIGACSPPIQQAIDAANAAGAVVVVSAGNDAGNADLKAL